MIQVSIPASSGDKERQNGVNEWEVAKPHVVSTYPIYPTGVENHDYGVQITRDREHWSESVHNENTVNINAHGRTQVFIGDVEITGVKRWERVEVQEGIDVIHGRTLQLSISDETSECTLRVIKSGREVATAKLSIVNGEERDSLLMAERLVDMEWVGRYTQGTSDFG